MMPRVFATQITHSTLLAVFAMAVITAAGPAVAQPPADAKNTSATDDIAKKAEILRSPRWRRAIFELGEWLDTQEIYPPKQVLKIKADFNQRVAKMSSYELEYLLEDLETKFKVIDSPEAKDARAWVGQYLSAMSDRKREEVLKDIPDIVTMSSGQLSQEIQKIETKRQSLQQQQAAFDQGRQALAEQAQEARQQTAMAAARSAAQSSGPAYSPYRSQGGGKPPFSDVHGSGMSIGVGPFGAYVGFNVGNF
jgi:outer membrane murein-binding lipoprotein Lpp